MNENLLYTATAGFEAARQLSDLDPANPALRLHGHSFQARIRAALPAGWRSFPGGEADALKAHFQACLQPLDYEFLNHHLPNPSDERLVRWIASHLDVPGLSLTGITSKPDQGVDLDARQRAHVWRRYRFEAAHQLPNVPAGHQCGRMHGHGFDVILHVERDPHQQESEADYSLLDQAWQDIFTLLDHACLNDIQGLENPTSEVLAAWMWRRLVNRVPALSCVTVYETATAGCHFNGSDYRIWKEQRFEAALSLGLAPEDDVRRRLHGHSYLLRLHLSAALDPVMGWTVDYGDVKSLFKPIYAQLDHHRLDAIDDLASAELGELARWIYRHASQRLPRIDRVDLFQTPGCGVIALRGDKAPALPV